MNLPDTFNLVCVCVCVTGHAHQKGRPPFSPHMFSATAPDLGHIKGLQRLSEATTN